MAPLQGMSAMRDDDGTWSGLEAWLQRAFAGQMRKHGLEAVAWHSIRIGRRLRNDGADSITVFGGYAHDVMEDVREFKAAAPQVRREMLMPVAMAALGDRGRAEEGVLLAEACTYSHAEYALPKAERKAVACARWLASGDIRLLLVKRADVEDNRTDCARVSPQFEADYLSWAAPFHAGLCQRIAELRGSGPAPRA
jgi:hypothetical protein